MINSFKKLIFLSLAFLFSLTGLKSQEQVVDSLIQSVKELDQESQIAELKNLNWKYKYNQPEISLYLLDYLEELEERNQDSLLEAYCLTNKLLVYYFLSQDKKSDSLLKVCQANFQHAQGKLAYNYASDLGNFYFYAQDFLESSEYFLKASDIASREGALEDGVQAYSNLSAVFQRLGEWKRANDYSRKAVALSDEVTAVMYLNFASTFQLEMENYDSALFYSRKAIHTALSNDEPLWAFRAASNISNKALEYQDNKTIAWATNIIDSLGVNVQHKEQKTAIYYGKAFQAFLAKEYNSAIAFADSAITIGKEHGKLYSYRALAQYTQANSLARLGRYKEAYESALRLAELKDSVYDYRVSQKVITLEEKYKNKLKQETIEKQEVTLLAKEKELTILTQEEKLKNTYIILLLIGLLLIGVISFAVINRQRLKTKNERIRIKLAEEELENVKLKEEKLSNDLEVKQIELASYTLSLVRKTELINKLKEQVGQLETEDNKVNEVKKVLRSSQLADVEWEEFKLRFENVNPGFYKKLRTNYPQLSKSDFRLAALLKLNLTNREIASLSGVNIRSVDQHKYRLKRKMNLDSKSLEEFIVKL